MKREIPDKDNAPIFCVAISPNGKQIASDRNDN